MHFSTEKISVYCNEMHATLEKIKTNLENINSVLEKLSTSGCWNGNGYQYYYRKLKEITDEFEDVYFDILSNIHYLEQTSENYSSLDKQIIMKVSNLFNITE